MSPAAFKLLNWLVSDIVVLADAVAVIGMKALAHGHGDNPIDYGESSGANMGLILEASG
jgi:diaminopropionate ammonia-lyase